MSLFQEVEEHISETNDAFEALTDFYTEVESVLDQYRDLLNDFTDKRFLMYEKIDELEEYDSDSADEFREQVSLYSGMEDEGDIVNIIHS